MLASWQELNPLVGLEGPVLVYQAEPSPGYQQLFGRYCGMERWYSERMTLCEFTRRFPCYGHAARLRAQFRREVSTEIAVPMIILYRRYLELITGRRIFLSQTYLHYWWRPTDSPSYATVLVPEEPAGPHEPPAIRENHLQYAFKSLVS